LGNAGPTSAHGGIGHGRNINVEPTFGQHMHFDGSRSWVMVDRATLAQRLRMVGLVMVGMSMSSQSMHYECARRRVMVGRACVSLTQRRRMVGWVAVGMSTSSQRWASVCILSVHDVGWWSARQYCMAKRGHMVRLVSDRCRRQANVWPT